MLRSSLGFFLFQSSPAFDVNLVTPDEAGANLVKSYTLVDYPFDENQLRKMGKSDMIISLVSAVCSNFHLLNVSIFCFRYCL